MITFWKAGGKYGAFSNFATGYPLQLEGKVWPTTEHLFQAFKYNHDTLSPLHSAYMEVIRTANTPMIAKYLARQEQQHFYSWQEKYNEIIAHYGSISIRPDWDQVKEEVMWRLLYLKFTTYPELRELLLSTGDEEIAEASPYDGYWGLGLDGKGKNRLGVLLMKLRDHFRTETEPRTDGNLVIQY